MKIELVQNEDLTVKTKTGSTVTVPSPSADDTLATMADATLTDVSVQTDWVFADGLLEAARENLPAVPLPNRLEIFRLANADIIALVEDGHSPTEDGEFGDVVVVENAATMGAAAPWALAIIPVGGTVATRSTVSGYKLGSQSNKPLAPARDYALKSEIPTLPLSITNGGTGATAASAACANIGAVPRTGDAALTGDYRTTGMVAGSEAVGIDDIAAGDIFEGDYYVVLYSEGILLGCDGTEETRTAIPGGKQASDPTNSLPVLATDAQHNLLDYTSGYALAPQTAVYRCSADMSGTSASIPSLTYTGIPTSDSYYCFELETYVPDTATSLTGPTTSSDPPWIWIPGGELPTYGYAGKTVFIACRMDCTSRKVMANCYLVGDSIMETLASAAP